MGQPPGSLIPATSYGSRDTVKLAEVPSKLATTIAVDFTVTVSAVNWKGALMAPAGMLTYVGIVTIAEFVPSPRATLVAATAVEVRVTVHTVLPSDTIDVAVHDSLEILVTG